MQVKLFHPTHRNTPLIGVKLSDPYAGRLELYFSYDTIVAFQERGQEIVASQNVWSSTTGRHLNEIDGGEKEERKDRVSHQEFRKALDEAMARFFSA